MRHRIIRAVALGAILVALVGFCGCGTLRGMGQDLQGLGQMLEGPENPNVQ